MIAGLPEITETKTTLGGARKSFSCRLVARAPGEAVLLYVSDRAWRVGDLELPPGTVTFGYFWAARGFNVYHWMTPAGVTLALYVNLADETVIGEQVAWRDLAVDLLLRPAEAVEVLDEAELPPDLDPALRARIEQEKARLLAGAAPLRAEIERASTAHWTRVFGSGR